MLTRPLIDSHIGHSSKISHLGTLVANKCLIERCRLNLDMPRLDSAFFRQRVSLSVNTPTKLIDRLAKFHDESFVDCPKAECKTGAGVFMDAIAKQKVIKMKHRCKNNSIEIQKRLCEDFLHHQELEEDHW